MSLRFKYLEKMHEEEMKKILVYLKGFTAEQKTALAQITALWLASGQVPPTILPILINVSRSSFFKLLYPGYICSIPFYTKDVFDGEQMFTCTYFLMMTNFDLMSMIYRLQT